jgi:succinate dehydrogenase flavin-adding protein (antitoxin of CptAB toxin-antitoxin module)
MPARHPKFANMLIPSFRDVQLIALHQFVAALDQDLKHGAIDVRDSETFVQILETAIKTCGLDQKALTELFETSHTSVSRWLNGKNLPHKQYRLPIVKRLRDKVEDMIVNYNTTEKVGEFNRKPGLVSTGRAQTDKEA